LQEGRAGQRERERERERERFKEGRAGQRERERERERYIYIYRDSNKSQLVEEASAFTLLSHVIKLVQTCRGYRAIWVSWCVRSELKSLL
jgi:hypothetical protein